MLKMIDVFSGVGGFSIASDAFPDQIQVIGHVEHDGYKSHILDTHYNVPNFGDINYFAVPESEIPYSLESLEVSDSEALPTLISSCQAKRQPKRNSKTFNEDLVPSEHYDVEFASLEDFNYGVIETPDIMTFSVPCRDCSRSNFQRQGMDGQHTSLVTEEVRICEMLEPGYVLTECTEDFIKAGMGGSYLIHHLSEMGYTHVQWQIVSGAALGFPQLRHRVFIVACRPDTAVAQNGTDVFTELTRYAQKIQKGTWQWHCPTKNKIDREYAQRHMIDKDPKAIQWRSLAINALGDGLIPKIPELIFKSIVEAESCPQVGFGFMPEGTVTELTEDMTLSRKGAVIGGVYYAQQPDPIVDIARNRKDLKGKLFNTLFRKEGNNLCSGKTRANRPGSMGGFAGMFRAEFGITEGGLSKKFATRLMGYPRYWV